MVREEFQLKFNYKNTVPAYTNKCTFKLVWLAEIWYSMAYIKLLIRTFARKVMNASVAYKTCSIITIYNVTNFACIGHVTPQSVKIRRGSNSFVNVKINSTNQLEILKYVHQNNSNTNCYINNKKAVE